VLAIKRDLAWALVARAVKEILAIFSVD